MNKLLLRIFIVSIMLSIGGETVAIELNEAITVGYNHNEEWKSIKVNFLNEIEQFPEALSGFLPRVSAGIDSINTRSKNKSQYDVNSISSESKNLQKTVNLEQPIFNGGSNVAGLRAAQSSFRASRSKFYSEEQKIILGMIKAYLDCYETQEKYEISEASVRSNKKQLEVVEEKMKLEEATRAELASAMAGLAAAETNKLTSYANFQAAKANFIRIFGIEPTNITMPELPDNLPASLDELQGKAIMANPNIGYIKHSIQAAKANEMVNKGVLLPQVSFRVQAGRNYYDQEERFGNKNAMSVTSVVSVNIPIYSHGGAEYSKIRQAKNKTRLYVIQLDNQLKEINSNVTESWEGFKAAQSKLISTSQGIEAAQIAYEGIMQEELVGAKMILDVLDAEDRLNKARQAKIEASKEHILNAYQMKSLIGQLTAKSLKLKVAYFSPEKEFNKIKMKIIGF